MSIGPVIDDNNFTNFITGSGNPELHGRGYAGMWETPGALQAAGTFADIGIPLVPETEWDDHIRQIEKDHATIPELCDSFGLDVMDQARTNYCWIFAVARCCEVVRLKETGTVYSYSAASAGAPIKNFRNVGGWGSQGLEYIKKHGINLTEDWPDTAIDRDYYTDANREKAKKHLALEYYTISNWAEMGSCILAGYPTANGYPWWGHEVAGVQLIPGSHDLVIDNSWSKRWGKNGRGTLSGSRKRPSDCVCITGLRPL